MPLSADHLRALSAIVGEANVSSIDVAPGTQEEVAQVAGWASRRNLALGRDFSLSLQRLQRIIEYNAPDLTICVEAGATLAAIDQALRPHRQFLPLGAARPAQTTVADVVNSNLSGSFRLFYGTPRDMVIGVRFATCEGKIVKSGGKVVKNVAGYDIAKLIIGSYGTLAVLTQVNFKVFPRPVASETLAMGFGSLNAALSARDAILRSPLTPLALDLLDLQAVRVVAPQELPPGEWVLAAAYGASPRVIERYRHDLSKLGRAAGMSASATLSGHDEERVWSTVAGLSAHMEEQESDVLRLRVSGPIASLEALITASAGDMAVAHAGNGVARIYSRMTDPSGGVDRLRRSVAALGGELFVEFSGAAAVDRWGPPGPGFAVMRDLKKMFDPQGILNPGVFVGGL